MRWLLTSWGSLGDLHPFLALGRGLQARGHEVSMVGHPAWADEAAAAGIRYVGTNEPPREDLLEAHPQLLDRRWGGLTALRTLVNEVIAPGFDPMMEALLPEMPQHDVLLTHHFTYPGAAAAEKTGIPWATICLAPGVVPSNYSLPGANFGRAGNGFLARQRQRMIWAFGRRFARSVIDPVVNDLRARHGLPPVRDAVFGRHGEKVNLQLYSEHFAPRPPDWDEKIAYAGFCPYVPPASGLTQETEQFLAAGAPPILFTLGSAVVKKPGAFFENAVRAITALGLRAILLIGPEANRPAHLPETVLALPYAPYGELMPRVRAVVHQCGIGTLSHALLAGVPSVAYPFAFDQPNNARRLEALGVAEVILPDQREASFVEAALRRLLSGDAPARAARLGEKIRAENGVARACTVLERTFGSRTK